MIIKEENTVQANRVPELRAELTRRIASYVGKEEKRITEVPGLTLVRRTAPTPPCRTTYMPGVIVVAQGSKQARLGEKNFTYDEAHFLVTSVNLPIVSWVATASEAHPCLVVSLKLEMSMVRELLGQEEIHVAQPPLETPGMSLGKLTPELLGACCRLLDLLNSPQDIPFLSGLIQREIIYRILRGPEGARLRAIATVGDQSHRAAKAIAWITGNYAKTLRVQELAEIAGMGVSTFHHHFRVLTEMSPLQYQKQLRLQSARNLMLNSGLDAASAGFEVGYESATQFSREYSRFFGRPPIRDIRTLQSSSIPTAESIGNQTSAD